MKTITVECRVVPNYEGLLVTVNAYAAIDGLGEVVIGSGRDEFQAQLSAAKFLDTNYPDRHVIWIGGYHGGDTRGGRPTAGYYPN